MEEKNIERGTNSWHSFTAEEAVAKLDTAFENGLDEGEVAKRRKVYGYNKLTPKKGTPDWVRFLLQFNQPLVYILLVATGMALVLKEWVDASVIFAVIFVNAIVGYLQESKAVKALEALSKSMISPVTVRRGGRTFQISSEELVPGDVVFLSSGDKVTADMRIVWSKDLQVNESPLTGESVPVEKKIEPISAEAGLADRTNMVYAGTFITYGRGRALVVETGDYTEVGRISGLIATADNLETPLTIKIAQFSHYLLWIILGLSVVTFAVGILRGNSFSDMFMTAIALAVGAIPEGLPAAVTITLAIGVSRMAKRRAIIRKLPAVETLGSTGVICSDKTGTLTKNQMTVQEVFTGQAVYNFSGSGYSEEGRIEPAESAVKDPALLELLKAGLLCNDSGISVKDGLYSVDGDPTEAALLVSARKLEKLSGINIPRQERKDSVPFESEYQYMAVLNVKEDSESVVYVKGAVEQVLKRCIFSEGLTASDVSAKAEGMALRGLRVLAFAMLGMPKETSAIKHEDIKGGLTFIGLQGMIDPPRSEAAEAVQECHTAGIRVKMITGDHALTASAIAEKLGLAKDRAIKAVSGAELEKMSSSELEMAAEANDVFARVTPEQKIRLVKALQSKGSIVAMTGDGVNDAPALKQANIGIAMGKAGTEVAKEASDMVLTDDNFASIVAAVEEGRCVFDNLRKFIVWTLPTNLGEALAVMIAIFVGFTLPIAPVQILWINMTTAILLGMMLAFEPKEEGLMLRPPRDPKSPIISKSLVVRTFIVGVLLALGVFLLFFYELSIGKSLEEARTVAVAVLVIGEFFYLFNCRSLYKSFFKTAFFSNKLLLAGAAGMVALQLFFTYNPVMNKFFHSSPIALDAWVRIFLVGFAVFVIIEIEKAVRRRR